MIWFFLSFAIKLNYERKLLKFFGKVWLPTAYIPFVGDLVLIVMFFGRLFEEKGESQ